MSEEREQAEVMSAQDEAPFLTNDKISRKATAGSLHTSAHKPVTLKDNQTARNKVKDSIFCHLFQDKRYLLQLYQALHPEDVEITEDSLTNITMERAVRLKQRQKLYMGV